VSILPEGAVFRGLAGVVLRVKDLDEMQNFYSRPSAYSFGASATIWYFLSCEQPLEAAYKELPCLSNSDPQCNSL
jgi:hypothetical protein